MELKVINAQGQSVGQIEVPEDVANAPVKRHAIWETVRWQLAKRRQGTHSTKTRGEVRGGGRKPWPQKHTGRARQGSIRAPQWVGGGVVFGPKPRNYEYRLPKKVRKTALKSTFAGRLREGAVVVLKDLSFQEPKTKRAVEVLDKLGLSDKKVLFVVPSDVDYKVLLSFRNLPNVKFLPVEGLNVYDLLNCDRCVVFESVFPKIIERLER